MAIPRESAIVQELCMTHSRVLMMGNEAIARGALEGGVSYCTG